MTLLLRVVTYDASLECYRMMCMCLEFHDSLFMMFTVWLFLGWSGCKYGLLRLDEHFGMACPGRRGRQIRLLCGNAFHQALPSPTSVKVKPLMHRSKQDMYFGVMTDSEGQCI